MSPRCALCSLVAFLVLSSSPLAAAQPASPDKVSLAKQHVKDGLLAQEEGRYDEAISSYGKAYELVPHPLLLFNMAQAHRLAGRPLQARDLYREYLLADPNGAKAQIARQLITALNAQLGGAVSVAPIASPPTATAPSASQAVTQANGSTPIDAPPPLDSVTQTRDALSAEPSSTPEPAPPTAASRSAPPPASPAAPAPPALELTRVSPSRTGARGRSLRIAGVVGLGVGVVGLGTGAFFHRRAASLSDELSKPGAPYDLDKKRDGESAERMMYVGYAAGGALIIGGVTLYLLGRRAGSERVALLPTVSPQGSGLAVVGSWR